MRTYVLVALVMLAPAASALDWTTPEGSPTASGVVGSDGEGDPTPLWRRTFPGEILAIAPTDDLVLVSSGQVLHALEKRTGEPRWTYDAGDRRVASVIVAGATAYILEVGGAERYASHAERIAALDLATGAERWATHAQAQFAGSITYGDGRVLMGSTTGVLALDADDGSLAWTVPLAANKPIAPMPGLVGALIPEAVVALRAEDGSEAWRIARPGCILRVHDRVAVQDGVMYVGGSGEGECIDAYEIATQRKLWALDTPFARNYTPTTPLPQGERAYLTSGSTIYAYDARTGAELWSSPQFGHGGLTDLLVGPTRLFASHLLGYVSIVDPATGANVTRFRADGTDGPVGADAPGLREPFVVSDGVLFATQYRDKATLHALDLGGTRAADATTAARDAADEGAFPWWIVLLVAAAAAVVGFLVWQRKRKAH